MSGQNRLHLRQVWVVWQPHQDHIHAIYIGLRYQRQLLFQSLLTVNGQHLQTVLTEKGLTARLGINDTQALMSQYSRASAPYSAPVRTAVANPAAHLKSLLT